MLRLQHFLPSDCPLLCGRYVAIFFSYFKGIPGARRSQGDDLDVAEGTGEKLEKATMTRAP